MSCWIFGLIIYPSPSVKKHKTVKIYLLRISRDHLVNFKHRLLTCGSGAGGGIVRSVSVSEMTVHNNSTSSDSATKTVTVLAMVLETQDSHISD
jgi:hypothetical protein